MNQKNVALIILKMNFIMVLMLQNTTKMLLLEELLNTPILMVSRFSLMKYSITNIQMINSQILKNFGEK